MPKRIILVGHCGIDGPRLEKEVNTNIKSADVLRINSEQELKAACDEGADLLLVNREPLGFDGTDGVDLIRELHNNFPEQKIMLVSDYDDAQEQAVEAGAIPGFGKGDIGTPKLANTLRQALA